MVGFVPFAGVGEGSYIDPNDEKLVMLFGSLVARINLVFPVAVDLINEHNYWLLGGGIGRFGPANILFADYTDSIENTALFLVGTFGLPILVYLVWLASRMMKLKPGSNPKDLFIALIFMPPMTYGIATNVTNDAIASVFIGIALASLHLDYGVTNRSPNRDMSVPTLHR